jgi:hypothetical protein
MAANAINKSRKTVDIHLNYGDKKETNIENDFETNDKLNRIHSSEKI